MKNKAQIEALCKEKGFHYYKDVSLKEYTSFKIGGSAAIFLEPASIEELRDIISVLSPLGRIFFLGKGTNLLVDDAGIDGMVLHVGKKLSQIEFCGEEIMICEGGASLMEACVTAKDHSLTGMEFAYGIPGSIGGAVYMNAGAYGGDMSKIVLWCESIDQQGRICRTQGEELAFSYRKSCYTGRGDCIARVAIRLQKGEKEEIFSRMKEIMARRVLKQPLEFPSAGSTFKRPEGAYAGALIEQSGLKGASVGGAMVSEKHANFLINTGSATSADMLELIRRVQRTVKEKTGYDLECEVLYTGKKEGSCDK